MKNVGVVGYDAFNRELLSELRDPHGFAFHGLLDYEEAVRPASGRIDFDALVALAERRIGDLPAPLDAVIGWWDFPTSAIAPLLKRRHGLPGPALEAVAACEHKYWSRLEQAAVLPDLVPRFQALDPFTDDPWRTIDLPTPFWIKPVKAHSSYLGFKIDGEADFARVLPLIRAGIGHFGEPFNTFLQSVDVPAQVAPIDGNHCIAETIISEGSQCTLEGYVQDGKTTVYGVVDSIREGRHRSSFSRYQYPSRLPAGVQTRMIEAAALYMPRIGYDSAPFNMEFYWSPVDDRIRLLEVNTRISKSHSPLFAMVDGAPHQQIALDLALGKRPRIPEREGPHRIAAKFMMRVFEDAVIRRAPDASDLATLNRQAPDIRVRIMTAPGERLSHMPYQDSYSYEIAELFVGASSQEALLEKYRAAARLLPFEFAPPETER